jgi:hypothetical protein
LLGDLLGIVAALLWDPLGDVAALLGDLLGVVAALLGDHLNVVAAYLGDQLGVVAALLREQLGAVVVHRDELDVAEQPGGLLDVAALGEHFASGFAISLSRHLQCLKKEKHYNF